MWNDRRFADQSKAAIVNQDIQASKLGNDQFTHGDTSGLVNDISSDADNALHGSRNGDFMLVNVTTLVHSVIKRSNRQPNTRHGSGNDSNFILDQHRRLPLSSNFCGAVLFCKLATA